MADFYRADRLSFIILCRIIDPNLIVVIIFINTQTIRTIYITISGTLFVVALILQTTPRFLTDDYSRTRLIFFVSWSCFGFLPCLHWVWQNGGFSALVFVRYYTLARFFKLHLQKWNISNFKTHSRNW